MAKTGMRNFPSSSAGVLGPQEKADLLCLEFITMVSIFFFINFDGRQCLPNLALYSFLKCLCIHFNSTVNDLINAHSLLNVACEAGVRFVFPLI